MLSITKPNMKYMIQSIVIATFNCYLCIETILFAEIGFVIQKATHHN